MRGLLLYDDVVKMEEIKKYMITNHAFENVESKDLKESFMQSFARCDYDYVVFIMNLDNAEKINYEHFAKLFSEFEDSFAVLLTESIEQSFWNDKFDYVFTYNQVRDLVKVILKKVDQKSASKNAPSWSINRLIVHEKKDIHFIPFEDIVFIEKEMKHVIIHLKDNTIETRMNLSEIEKKLPDNFIRIHRAYIANINYVSKIENIGNRSYEINFYETPKVALMSRYKADAILDSISIG